MEYDSNQARAAASVYGGASTVLGDSPLIERILERLNEMRTTAEDAVSRLATTRDRIFGCPPPSNATGANGPQKEIGTNRADELEVALSQVSTLLYSAQSLASELQQRI